MAGRVPPGLQSQQHGRELEVDEKEQSVHSRHVIFTIREFHLQTYIFPMYPFLPAESRCPDRILRG